MSMIVENAARQADAADGGRVAAVESGPVGLFQELHVAYLWQTSMRKLLGLPADTRSVGIELAVRKLKTRVEVLKVDRDDFSERYEHQHARAEENYENAKTAEARVAKLEQTVRDFDRMLDAERADARTNLARSQTHQTELAASERRMAVLETQLRDGMPSGTETKDPVPRDQKTYRVWTRSRVVEWERGPNVWIRCDDAEWHATNCDGWLPEPEEPWEGEPR